MHICIIAQGTRGDVQPMIALGHGLQAAGHHVSIIAGSNFEGWVRGHGIEFTPTIDMEAVMQSERGVAWTESSNNPLKQLQIMRALLTDYGAAMTHPINAHARQADLMIASFVSEPFVQSVSEKSGTPYINAFLQPFRATTTGPASLNALIPTGNSRLNRWMGLLGERMIWSIAADTTNSLRAEIGLSPHTARTYSRRVRHHPTALGVSRHVVPPAADWGVTTEVCGYWFLDEDWSPPANLVSFLNAGSPPVYIGFGSMSSKDPQATLTVILEAARVAEVRVLIASGWGKVQAENLPNNAFIVPHAPHTWLFERVAAVVHHGGAGTTAAGLRAGKPTFIVPHMSDQPYWGRRVHELGAGIRSVLRHKLTTAALASGLRQLTADMRLHDRAAQLGQQIRAERGIDNALRFIEAHAPRR